MALILIGAVILAYGQFSYRSRDTVLKIGADQCHGGNCANAAYSRLGADRGRCGRVGFLRTVESIGGSSGT